MKKVVRIAALYAVAVLAGAAVAGWIENRPWLWVCLVSMGFLAIVATLTLRPVARFLAREDIAKLSKEVFLRNRQIAEIRQPAGESAFKPAAPAGPAMGAPQVLVSYEPDPREILTFSNDGPTAFNVDFGPLVSKAHRPIALLSSIPSIRTGEKQVRRMILEHRLPNGAPQVKLNDLLRRESDTEFSVAVSYRDAEGRRYVRDFTLSAQVDGCIFWIPGPVTLKPGG